MTMMVISHTAPLSSHQEGRAAEHLLASSWMSMNTCESGQAPGGRGPYPTETLEPILAYSKLGHQILS